MTTGQHVERYADVDLYGVLHLTAEASAELIERAYKVRIIEVHPDHAGAASTEQAALVNAAGEILRDQAARARYDALRATRRARAGPNQAAPPGQPRGPSPGEDQRRRELEEQLAAARQDLAACRADLAASEANRWALHEQVQRLAGQVARRPARWLWASGGAGGIIGAIALSLVLGTAGSSRVRAAPYTPPLVVPAPAASAVAGRGADAEWPATLRDLDATWEQDWPRTIAVLDTFLSRWPSYPAAEDKLYAALLADAEAKIQAEQVSVGVAELERATRGLPERGEAWARLAQLATATQSGQT